MQLVVDELLAGCCQKTVHSRFVDSSFFVIALALDSPEVTFHRLGHQIDAGILATQVVLVGELFPEPDMLELAFIPGNSLQKSLH